MTSTMFLVMLMVFAGGIAAAQSAINAQLSGYLGNPIGASFISFLVGTLVLGLLLLFSKQKMPGVELLTNTPPRYLLGGICGCVFITTAIYLVPKIGVVNVLFLGLAGQMIVSLAIDSFGLFEIKQQPISLVKATGVVLILSGIIVLKSGFNPAHAKSRLYHASPQAHVEIPFEIITNRKFGVISNESTVSPETADSTRHHTADLACKLKDHKVRRQCKIRAKNMRTRYAMH